MSRLEIQDFVVSDISRDISRRLVTYIIHRYVYYSVFILLFTLYSYLLWSLTLLQVFLYLFNAVIIMCDVFISLHWGFACKRRVFFMRICVVDSRRVPTTEYFGKRGVALLLWWVPCHSSSLFSGYVWERERENGDDGNGCRVLAAWESG